MPEPLTNGWAQRTLEQAERDSRTIIRLEEKVDKLASQNRSLMEEIRRIRQGQGRAFFAAVVATTGSIVAILTVILAASGLGQ